MVTKEDLQITYAKLSNQELMKILDNKFDYTELAITVALEEMATRSISEEDIKQYKEGIIRSAEEYVKRNIVDDLTFFQKCFFFFLFVASGPFKMNLREDGYILKLKQANYYNLLGLISSFLTVFISLKFDLPTPFFLVVWASLLIPSYLLDEYFNRERLRKKLGKMFEISKEED